MIDTKTTDTMYEQNIPYILGPGCARSRKSKIMCWSGRYKEVVQWSHQASYRLYDARYIVCFNTKQARKDAAVRDAIVESLKKQLQRNQGDYQ